MDDAVVELGLGDEEGGVVQPALLASVHSQKSAFDRIPTGRQRISDGGQVRVLTRVVNVLFALEIANHA